MKTHLRSAAQRPHLFLVRTQRPIAPRDARRAPATAPTALGCISLIKRELLELRETLSDGLQERRS